MKILDRYIFKELFLTFTLSLFMLMSVFLTQQILRFSRISADTGISFLVLIKLAPLIIPLFLVLAIPLAMLLSSILTFARFSTDREITAFKSAGLSLYRLLPSVIIFSTLALLLSLISSIILQPLANNRIKQETYEALKSQKNLGLQEGVFNNLFNLLVYVKTIKSAYNLEGVIISDKSQKESKTITAKHGKFLHDPSTESLFLKLSDGQIHYESPDRANYQLATFSTYYLKIDTNKSIENIRLFKTGWGLSLHELKKLIKEKKMEKKERDYRRLLLEFYKKFTSPAIVIVLGVLGVPIGIRSRFSSKFAGFIVSLAVIFLYYIVDTGCEILAIEGVINPVLSAWTPMILFLILTLYILMRESKENVNR